MRVISSMDIQNGVKVKDFRSDITITQPIQFVRKDEKDDDWCRQNMDWFENIGLQQVAANSSRIIKNYRLANGIIDRTDYIVEDTNEYGEVIDVLTQEVDTPYDLKFYPIIPNVINVLTGEFAKRRDKITYKAVDDISYNDMMNQKREDIERYLVTTAENKLREKLIASGYPEEELEQAVQENVKTLPEIEEFYTKDYRDISEQWATAQHEADLEKFRFDELEITGFRDMLICDREFWHFDMLEDDYNIELWNPALTFYHKSPDVKYVSQGSFAGTFDLITVADAIDKYGHMMTEEQQKALESIYPGTSTKYLTNAKENDGSYYDATKSKEWNMQHSLEFRKLSAFLDLNRSNDGVVENTLSIHDNATDNDLLRTSRIYWKSKKRVGWLTEVTEDGLYYTTIVSEDFVVTEKPEYDFTYTKEKTSENLVYGQHVEWIWINEVWGGIKIGANSPNYFSEDADEAHFPMYLKVKPTKYQFKGDYSLYGCKLPVEGRVFSERNSESRSLVDLMKPFQIGYNMVNNQLYDILIDELGSVILFDHNTLPQESMGETWGKNNYSKAYTVMKNFQMLPLDTSIANTENATSFQHFQAINLEQTNRLMSRIQLANYFKMEAFQTVGITPERLGNIAARESATGIEQSLAMSYSQTEKYFIQHAEYLMPRVHEMRTDLAQYYHTTNPSKRLTYLTSNAEKINFEINGDDLLLKDINVYVTTKVNQKEVLEKLKMLALNNNTSGANIYDLAQIIKADTLSEVEDTVQLVENKMNKVRQEQMAHEQKMNQDQLEAAAKEKELERQYKELEAEKERAKDIHVATIRAGGYQVNDLDNNNQVDFLDVVKVSDAKYQKEQDRLDKQQARTQEAVERDKDRNLKREELAVRKKISDNQLKQAKENKNRYDK